MNSFQEFVQHSAPLFRVHTGYSFVSEPELLKPCFLENGEFPHEQLVRQVIYRLQLLNRHRRVKLDFLVLALFLLLALLLGRVFHVCVELHQCVVDFVECVILFQQFLDETMLHTRKDRDQELQFVCKVALDLIT